MNYDEWASLKVGDRVKRVFNSPKGTIISDVGVGYVVKWDNGTTEKITDGILSRVQSKTRSTNNGGVISEREIELRIDDIAMQVEELSAMSGGMLYVDILNRIAERLDIEYKQL